MALFGSLGKWLGKGLKGASKVAGFIPGVGTAIGAGMGGLGEFMESGTKTNFGDFLKSTAGGAMGGLAGGAVKGAGLLGGLKNFATGGGLGALMKGGAAVLGGKALWDANKQMGKDQQQARDFANQSAGLFGKMQQGAEDRYGLNSPLRNAFRFGVLNAQDPTNPFGRGDMFAKFQSQLQQETGNQQTQARSAVPREQGGLGKMLGGRKPGAPVSRTASSKGVRDDRRDDRGRDSRDLRRF